MDFDTLVEEYLKLSHRTLAELLALEQLRKQQQTPEPYVLPTQPWPYPQTPQPNSPYVPPYPNTPGDAPWPPYPWITYYTTCGEKHPDLVVDDYTTNCSCKCGVDGEFASYIRGNKHRNGGSHRRDN